MNAQGKPRRTVIVTSYTLQELAFVVYGISKYHMRKLLDKHKDKIGERDGYFYETDQVRKIFELIPLPSNVDLV